MKGYLFLLCLMYPLSALADWTPIMKTSNLLISIDLSSISKVEVDNYRQYRKFWIKQTVIKEDKVLSLGDFSQNLYWLDCKNDAVIRKSLKMYSSEGVFERAIPYPDATVEYISPDTIMNTLAKKVCSVKL